MIKESPFSQIITDTLTLNLFFDTTYQLRITNLNLTIYPNHVKKCNFHQFKILALKLIIWMIFTKNRPIFGITFKFFKNQICNPNI